MGAFSQDDPRPQLVHIATDGETYGHHQQHGDMALAYALERIESDNEARLTNYGEFLEKYPPAVRGADIRKYLVELCAWGGQVGRDCGCNSGGHPGWNQAWRTPLRESLDWLRDTIAPLYEEHAGRLLKDPWEARNDFIGVVLDRTPRRISTCS